MAERNEIEMAKSMLRAEMLGRMATIDPAERRAASRALNERLLAMDEVRMAGTVLAYLAMRTEIDPAAAMLECLEEGIRVAVPIVDEESKELEAVTIDSLDPRRFVRDRFGVLVPRDGERIRATELDVVLVPGVAFDRCGQRLGRGAGFYDRLLVRLPPRCRTIGLGFHCQLVERVPVDGRDRPVDAVVTDQAFVEVAAPGAGEPIA